MQREGGWQSPWWKIDCWEERTSDRQSCSNLRWNRMVTRMMREQPHTTPVTTTWTADFLTREGEDRMTMGDWLHNKPIPWKSRRCLLQTNSGTFPCESRLQKWGKHSDGVCDLWKPCREMGLGLLGVNPARGTTGHLQRNVCGLQAPAATGAHYQSLQQVQEDMSKTRSVCKDWDLLPKGTEISVGRFLIEYFTPLTLGEQHQGALSDEDVTEVWLTSKSEEISKVRRTQGGVKGAETHSPDEKEGESLVFVKDSLHGDTGLIRDCWRTQLNLWHPEWGETTHCATDLGLGVVGYLTPGAKHGLYFDFSTRGAHGRLVLRSKAPTKTY